MQPNDPAFAARLDEILLGGPRRYTRVQAAARAGIPLERASELWRALGFASTPDAEAAFTDGDVQALRTACQLVDAGLVEDQLLRSVTRMVGQSMSRLAEWQSRLLLEVIAERPAAVPDGDFEGLLDRLIPALEQVQLQVWRRQLAAASQRLFSSEGTDPRSAELAVGFVDLAGYTSLSREIGPAELTAILEEFESATADLVAEAGGRIVKTIGDEVLFVAGTAPAAADIALSLQDQAVSSQRLPPLRIGLALGSVLTRFGDVYGPVVNIASRLTSIARTGTVLVDKAAAAELRDRPEYQLRRLRPTSVRGYHHLSASRLSRSEDRAEPSGQSAG